MPLNSKGKFFLNDQLMRAADKQPIASPAQDDTDQEQDDEQVVPSHKIEVHKHDDGTYHTITNHDDGSRTREEHPDLESVHAHEDKHFQDGSAQGEPVSDSPEDAGDHEYR